MATKIYREESGFSEIVTTALLALIALALCVAGAANLMGAEANHGWAILYFGVALVLGGVLYFLYRMKMKVVVSEKTIKYQLTPFHDKLQKIKWRDVADCEVVKTHPLAPNHGSHLASGERRFSLTGRNGLSILTKAGERYFIGCRDVDQLKESLHEHWNIA